jgi:hypothetical protein
MEALVGRRKYGSYSFLTAALDGVSGQRQAQTAILPRGKNLPVPTGYEVEWALELVWTQRLQKESPLLLSGIEP